MGNKKTVSKEELESIEYNRISDRIVCLKNKVCLHSKTLNKAAFEMLKEKPNCKDFYNLNIACAKMDKFLTKLNEWILKKKQRKYARSKGVYHRKVTVK